MTRPDPLGALYAVCRGRKLLTRPEDLDAFSYAVFGMVSSCLAEDVILTSKGREIIMHHSLRGETPPFLSARDAEGNSLGAVIVRWTTDGAFAFDLVSK